MKSKSYECNLNDSKKEVDEIMVILKDFGLNDQNIIDSIKLLGDYSKNLVVEDDPISYILAYHNAMQGDISEIGDYKYDIAHEILKWSKIGIYSDWKYDDDTALWNININLKIHGLEANFCPHEWDENFRITIGNANESFSSDLKYSTKYHDYNELIGVANQLLKNFNLIYLNADSGGDDFTFLLLEHDRYEQIKKTYGNYLNVILMPWKKKNEQEKDITDELNEFLNR